jgi:hypothetical protein
LIAAGRIACAGIDTATLSLLSEQYRPEPADPEHEQNADQIGGVVEDELVGRPDPMSRDEQDEGLEQR